MTTVTQEPKLSVDSLRFLTDFQNSFRARIYNLVEDYVRETGQDTISKAEIERLIHKALREYFERSVQKDMFQNV